MNFLVGSQEASVFVKSCLVHIMNFCSITHCWCRSCWPISMFTGIAEAVVSQSEVFTLRKRRAVQSCSSASIYPLLELFSSFSNIPGIRASFGTSDEVFQIPRVAGVFASLYIATLCIFWNHFKQNKDVVNGGVLDLKTCLFITHLVFDFCLHVQAHCQICCKNLTHRINCGYILKVPLYDNIHVW